MLRVRFLFITGALIFSLVGGGFFVHAQTTSTPDTKTAVVDKKTQEEVEALNREIEARKEKIKQLEQTIAEHQKVIDVKRTEAVSLKNQLSILDNHLAQLAADISLTQEKIRQTELEIETLSVIIKEKEAIIARQKNIIAKMVQMIHASDQKNYLEIFLTYETFADFFSQMKYTENVYIDLGRSVKSLRLAKEELDRKKAELVEKQKQYEALRRELEGKRDRLSQESTVKQNLLSATQSSEMQYRTVVANLRKEYQNIENEVRSIEARVRERLEEEQKIKETDGGLLSWPTPTRVITARFHDPDYPYRSVFEHSGLDIRAAQGTPVKAAGSGYVARARRCTTAACYSYVLIVHTGSVSTLYGHLSGIEVGDDAFVNRGDVIGYSGGKPGTVGAGPFVTGPHLHFEVRLNGIPVDPLGYLAQ